MKKTIHKEITSNMSPEKILKYFREATDLETVNLRTEKGFIFLAGGILSKLENNKQYIAHNNKWVLV